MSNLPLFANSEHYIETEYTDKSNIVLYHGDSKKFVKEIPEKIISLVITSPPYNLGKIYENSTSIDSYLEEQAKLIQELYRVLKDDGSICWQVGNFIKDGEVYPLDILYYPIFKKLGFHLRNRIIWYFGHGLHASKRFSGRYETILWFSKTNKYKFNLDPVRIPAKYPGKRHFKGGNIGKPSGNPLGKNPADVWEFLAKEWDELLWDIPNVKSNHPEKTIHPCQYPIELVERCVLAMTDVGDWVFDPYAGVGTSLIAAIMHDRRAMGSEKEEDYINIAKERISNYRNGSLKIRPLGKPVHQPTGNEKVSQIPEEWRTSAQLKLMEKKNNYL
jgi:site-specific DNA-methyltransferase (adenine-specific)/adenine-specific DNA-methyltransferase